MEEKLAEAEQAQNANAQGTMHQEASGARAKRKHFFSPLNPDYAEAVHLDAESVEYTIDEEVRQLDIELRNTIEMTITDESATQNRYHSSSLDCVQLHLCVANLFAKICR